MLLIGNVHVISLADKRQKTLISMVKVEYCGLHWLSPIYPYYVPNIHTSSIYMSVVGYISPLYLSLISRCVWHSPGPSAAAGASHLAFPGSGHSGNIGFCHYWIRWDAVRLVELMVQGHWDLLCSFSGRCRGELARASRASCIFGKHETPVAFLSFPDIFVDTKRYSANSANDADSSVRLPFVGYTSTCTLPQQTWLYSMSHRFTADIFTFGKKHVLKTFLLLETSQSHGRSTHAKCHQVMIPTSDLTSIALISIPLKPKRPQMQLPKRNRLHRNSRLIAFEWHQGL